MQVLKHSRRFSIVIGSILLVMMLFPCVAFASYAYDYGRIKDLNYTYTNVYAANDAWSKLGFSYTHYFTSFSKSTFLNNCPTGNAVYAYTHGYSSGDSIIDNGTGRIYRDEVGQARNGDWKRLVFLDACYTANDGWWAYYWGITDGDGSLHTYVGWWGASYDNATYSKFTTTFWSSVAARYTILESLHRAENASGVLNWNFYGNANWKY